MLIQQLASSQADAVFIVGQNVSNVTLSGSTLVCFESYGTLASSVSYGNAINSPSTSNLAAFAGVLNADLVSNGFGLVQVYGARQSIWGTPSKAAVSLSAQGFILGPAAGQVSAQSNGQSFAFGPIVVLDNDISGIAITVRGLIRAL
jgi:hypothetical protein